MTKRLLAASLLVLLAALPSAAQLALGQISGTVNYPNPNTAVSGWVTYLDISTGNFIPIVTKKSPLCFLKNQVEILGTDTFAAATGSFVAITANTGPANPASCAIPVGLIQSDFVTVNEAEDCGLELYFTSKTNAAITDGPLPDPTKVPIQWAVSGSTVTDNDCFPKTLPPRGQLLVHHGQPGVCVAPKSMTIAARGAAGLDVTGTILILVVITGVENSTGLRLLDFSSLLIGLGAYEAVNFDGGGSTAFIWSVNGTTEESTLVNIMTRAHVPAGVPNPSGFTFSVSRLPPRTTKIGYCATQPSPCRLVYAALGFQSVDEARKK